MNFETQLKLIRKEQHIKYLEQVNESNIVQILANLAYKYRHLFNPTPIEKAVRLIQKYIKLKFFHPKCINHEELKNIPAIYRFRINFTNGHTRNNWNSKKLDTKCFKILFSYCFDIRNLYLVQHRPININNNVYYLQPNDFERLNNIYKRVNNETNASINYLNTFNYIKSLEKDTVWNLDTNDTNDNINTHIERIGKIFQNEKLQITKPKYVIVSGIKISSQYINNLNKKYFTN